MPRASRYLVEGYTYHLTHRCHDRRFLLRFARERDTYREWLRIGAKRYGVSVYGYCVTSSHTHVVVHADDREAVGRLMQLAAAPVAKALNLRKGHEGSVWEHPYQCTLIQDGVHLRNCLRYVDLNMVRAGVVAHPSEWRWCAYDELTGRRKRYRVIDLEGLLQRLELRAPGELAEIHEQGIQERIARSELGRESHWTEAVAVGDRAFISAAESLYPGRHSFTKAAIDQAGAADAWLIREAHSPYSADFAPK